jgi:pyridoxal 5'-phosphate synthase pdxT subunit
MASSVGVVAIQGDFARHIEALRAIDGSLEILEVRTPQDLERVERVIIPGGESTTVGLLMQRFGLGSALKARAAEGMPIWGTCMGMIMMSRAVEGREQFTLDLLDITVRRNAFGAQVHSFEREIELEGLDEPVMGVFIRAPVVVECGESVTPLACVDGQVVAVRQGVRLGTSFHPELTSDLRVHRYFMGLPAGQA